jgi:hypothetical protein
MPRWFWTGGTVEYHLGLSPAEAAARLETSIKPDNVLRMLLPWPAGLVGRVNGTRFRLTARIPFVRNSFDSILEGEILMQAGGSKILASFRLRKFVLVFMTVWFGLALTIAISETISALNAPGSWSPGPPPILFPLLFPLFGILIVAVGRLLATWQERRLLAQLDAIFGVHPNGAEPSG